MWLGAILPAFRRGRIEAAPPKCNNTLGPCIPAGERAWTARDVEQCLFAEAAGAEAKAKSGKQPPRKKQKR
mgnify:CR=1 FL=1